MCGREGGALHVCRVLQFSHATANSTRRQIRDSRLQRGVARGGRRGVGELELKAACYHCTNTAGGSTAKSERQANVAGHCCAQFHDDVCGSEYLQRCTDYSAIFKLSFPI